MRHIKAVVILSVAVAFPSATRAQQLAGQIARAPDGHIRLSFATRAAVCGDGRFIGEDTPKGFRMYSFEGQGYSVETLEDVQPECQAGPLRLVITKAGGSVTDLSAAVGVSWRTASAATDLGTVPAAQAAAWLLDLAQNSSNDRLQAVAFVAANSADSARIAERLFSLAGDKRFARDVRSRSLRWLAEAARRENRSDEAERVQRAIIRDAGDAATVRERAIRELEPTEANEAFLRETYRDVSVMVLKERIIRTLAASGDSTSARWLREIAVSSEEPLEARDRALRVLAEQGAPSAELVSLYERVQGPSLRQRVVKVLVERGDDVAIEKLMQIADRDPDPAQRRYVLRRLSEMQNPKARVFLEGKVVR